jgi:hypothetical protein
VWARAGARDRAARSTHSSTSVQKTGPPTAHGRFVTSHGVTVGALVGAAVGVCPRAESGANPTQTTAHRPHTANASAVERVPDPGPVRWVSPIAPLVNPPMPHGSTR